MLSKQEKLRLFQSLFRGRTDIFARRWEKYDGSVSGYAPVYTDWKKKSYQPLSQDHIEKHLQGRKTVGLYPLMHYSTSYFIAADFDGGKWLGDAKKFLKKCNIHRLPVYVERSRSGKGGHVWCFFESTYPAYKSRAIFFNLLQKADVIDEYSRSESFDRLFPNQDYHSGKGFGNLIALPLEGRARKKNNTVFLDPKNNFEPAKDQWDFLQKVKRVPEARLDKLYEKFASDIPAEETRNKKEITLTLKNVIAIPKSQIPPRLVTYLREELNFLNVERIAKEKMGFSTHDTSRYFQTILSDDTAVKIPRGFLQQLTTYLTEHNIPFALNDKRVKKEPITFTPSFTLLPHQEQILTKAKEADCGVIVSPPGTGKTIIGLALIADRKQPALILTHRRQIHGQWVKSIESFLGIPKKDIGRFDAIKKDIKHPITVAMVQSLRSVGDWKTLPDTFGTVIVDECHHMPARVFKDVVSWLNPHYLYGLTATPKRKHGDEKLIYAYLGNLVAEIKREHIKNTKGTKLPHIEVIIKETAFALPLKPKTRDFHTVAKMLIADVERNAWITKDVVHEAQKHHTRCLVLTERTEHVKFLEFFLKPKLEVISLYGSLSHLQRKQREKLIREGDFQALIATGQVLGEGTDLPHVDTLFLVFPFSFEGKLIQYIGRIERGETALKRVYDYRDIQVELFERFFKQRQRYYNKIKSV